MIQNGYNGNIPLANASTIVGPAFTGGSNGYIQTIADLSSYNGQSVLVRFRMGSDVLTGATGWYVDDVDIVSNPTTVTSTAYVTSRFGGDVSATTETLVLKAGTLSQTSVSTAVAAQPQDILYPNPAHNRISLKLAQKAEGKVLVTVANAHGRQVRQQELSADEANNGTVLSLEGMATGLYYFTITVGEASSTHKVIIRR
jgi:hypothetical protein